MQLYDRTASLRVNDRTFHTRLRFSIVKFQSGGIGADSKITAFNLSQNSRNQIESAPNFSQKAYLSAGYGSDSRLLYSGTVFYAHTEREGPDILTIFELKGIPLDVRNTPLQYSGLPTDFDIFRVCLDKLKGLGVAKGSISRLVNQTFQSNPSIKGYSDSGTVGSILDQVMRRHNMRWSIDDGAFNVYAPGEYADSLEVFLSPETGMIGFPTKADAGNYKVRSLLNPDIKPGKKIKLKSIEAPAPVEIMVNKVTQTGDTLEGPWFADIEALLPGYELRLNGGGLDD